MRTRSDDAKLAAEQASTSASRGPKRPSGQTESAEEPQSEQAKTTAASQDEASTPSQKRRPTTPDLEFDFDRDQLRDPRPTPGRVKRPRYISRELDKEKFHINPEPKFFGVPSKDEAEEALSDPSSWLHDRYVCHRKGPEGSPTYDRAGFQLDWEKVDELMKPLSRSWAYQHKVTERDIERQQEEEKIIIEKFFVDGQGPSGSRPYVFMDFVKDHVSKDLGVPWHQIDLERVEEWEKKGFEKVKADEWWQEPNEEENKRMMLLLANSSLRKHL